MSGSTYGVAIGIPEPWGSRLAAERRRAGDPAADGVPPHITLLPPTRLGPDALPGVREHLAAVAAAATPFEVELRGAGTFRPVSPVVFVPLVRGISGCEQLERRVRSGPLCRELKFHYHPHVTVAHDVPDQALDGAYEAVAEFAASYRVTEFTLFEKCSDDVWRPDRAFSFAQAA